MNPLGLRISVNLRNKFESEPQGNLQKLTKKLRLRYRDFPGQIAGEN